MTQSRCLADLKALPESLLNAFSSAAKQSIFYSLPWFRNYLVTIEKGNCDLRLLTASEGNQDAALVMLAKQSDLPLSPRILIGAQNYYSCLFGPVYTGQPTDNLFDALLAPAKQERVDMLDLHPLDRESASYGALQGALRRGGWWVDEYFCFGNWYLHVEGRSYTQYYDSLPSKLKNTLKRKKKALDQAGNTRFEIIQSGPDVERAIADYIRIYNASWKVPEPYQDFMPGLFRTCAEHGWLRAGFAYVDGEPAAAQIWIVHDRQALIYKLAYDERFGKLSVGSILTAMLMEYVIDQDHVEIVDYLTGDEPYKRDWMSHRRERWGIIAYNPRSMVGLIHAAAHFGGKWLKSLRGDKDTSASPPKTNEDDN
ncbi:GNAT family N-acetyltransferase [Chitinivorax sp. B]|uniref:GNAT family N-acetyltransferase n=1 Tax=Chitinivorax sp. B TaxID=2502235 RepID=UPI0010F7CAFB|nr:GNAT family N-acetyltransferase [Chitinivorax sp. B]